jgi:hypothetical protein
MSQMGLRTLAAALLLQCALAGDSVAQTRGLSPAEMNAARKAVDPDGKYTDGERNIAALGAVYQYWMNKDEPEKAQIVAGQMLQHYRSARQRYAAITSPCHPKRRQRLGNQGGGQGIRERARWQRFLHRA